jgi:hypothetical protein
MSNRVHCAPEASANAAHARCMQSDFRTAFADLLFHACLLLGFSCRRFLGGPLKLSTEQHSCSGLTDNSTWERELETNFAMILPHVILLDAWHDTAAHHTPPFPISLHACLNPRAIPQHCTCPVVEPNWPERKNATQTQLIFPGQLKLTYM